jgi:YVTN family beta-propeller protein
VLQRLLVAAVALFACIALLSAKPYTFVAFHDQNQVGVYDHGGSIWLTPIPVGNGPIGVAADSLQRKVYVTNHRSDSISIFLIANRKNIGSIALASGAQPMGIAVSPTQPRAYVANFGTNTVSVINTLTNAVASTIPVGSLPTSVAITPNGDRVFVTNTGDNTISVIDAVNNTIAQTFAVSLPDNPQPRPYAIAFAPGGSGRLVVANNNGAMASVFDGASYTPLSNIALGAHPTALGVVNGNKVFALNSADATLSVIDPVAATVGAPIAVPSGAISLAVAADSSLASITISPSKIAPINTSTNAVGGATTSPSAFNSALTIGGFVLNPAYECSLDLNANGSVDNDDLVMVTRYLVGIRGANLAAGFPSLNGASIEAQLATFDLDADGDSAERATTDAILISRASRGLLGNALISNAKNTTIAAPPLRNASLILQWMLDAHGVNCLP